MRKVKIYRVSIGGWFPENELDKCIAYCKIFNCTYRTDYVIM